VNAAKGHEDGDVKLSALVRENVVAQLANLKTHPSVALALDQAKLDLHGWVYDIEAGIVEALDGKTGEFVPLAENTDVKAVSTR
jgi:carbonic anhydrase